MASMASRSWVSMLARDQKLSASTTAAAVTRKAARAAALTAMRAPAPASITGRVGSKVISAAAMPLKCRLQMPSTASKAAPDVRRQPPWSSTARAVAHSTLEMITPPITRPVSQAMTPWSLTAAMPV